MCLLKDISWCHQCADDFQLPYANGKYFPAADRSRVQAKEHRNIMQVCPHILNGIDEECCELMCRYGNISTLLVCMAHLSWRSNVYGKQKMACLWLPWVAFQAKHKKQAKRMGTRNWCTFHFFYHCNSLPGSPTCTWSAIGKTAPLLWMKMLLFTWTTSSWSLTTIFSVLWHLPWQVEERLSSIMKGATSPKWSGACRTVPGLHNTFSMPWERNCNTCNVLYFLCRRLGNDKHYNANFFEAGHHKTKLFCTGTSRKRHNGELTITST